MELIIRKISGKGRHEMGSYIEEAIRKLERQKKLFGTEYDEELVLTVASELAEEDAFSDYTMGV